MTTKTYTINELKTFIEAVEFAADTDEWIPSARQWKRIRDMIDSLSEPVAVAPTPQQHFRQVAPVAMIPHIPHPMDNIVIEGGQNGIPAAPAAPSAFATVPYAPQQRAPQAPLGAGGAMPVRTPDIDTSNGQGYQSGFA